MPLSNPYILEIGYPLIFVIYSFEDLGDVVMFPFELFELKDEMIK